MKKLVLIALALSSSLSLAQNRVSEFDQDGDARVSFTELQNHCTVSRQLFDRADKNGDGVLSNPELSSARRYLLTSCHTSQ